MDAETRPLATDTKRWKSSAHSIPAGADVNEAIHSRFVGDGGLRLKFDFSQMEVRVLAGVSRDQAMLAAFESGEDIHRLVTARVLDKQPDEVTPMERSWGKALTFATLYEKSPSAFADAYLDGNYRQAVHLLNRFHQEFPAMRRWIVQKHLEALQTGFTTTEWGDPMEVRMPPRALHWSDDWKKRLAHREWIDGIARLKDGRQLHLDVNAALRAAGNWPIQCMASSIAALTLWDIQQGIEANGCRAKIDRFVHDSGEIDLPANEVYLVWQLALAAVLQRSGHHGLPLDVDFSLGADGRHMAEVIGMTEHGVLVSGSLRAIEGINSAVHGCEAPPALTTDEREVRVPTTDLFSSKASWRRDYGKSHTVAEASIRWPRQ